MAALVCLLVLIFSAFGPPSQIAPQADADPAAQVVVSLGSTTGVISGVRNVPGTDPLSSDGQTKSPEQWASDVTCVRYSPAAGQGQYSTAVVGAQQYAAVGYGYSDDDCPAGYEGEPPGGSQSSIAFQPGASAQVNVGDAFLVGTIRHYNTDVSTGGDAITNPGKDSNVGTTYYGDLQVTTANGGIHANFPWVEVDSSNSQCYTQLDENGEIIIGAPAPTKYAADEAGRIGLASVDGPYRYAFDGSGQVDRRRTVRYDYALGGLTFGKGAGTYDKHGRDCTFDELRVESNRSDSSWVDPSTGISYKLKLWGFVNNGSDAACQVTPRVEAASLEERFITPEGGRTSYGCLYGSLEQVRPVTFVKQVDTDPALQATTAIPTFSFTNASPPGSSGQESWGSPSSLTPTGWGAEGTATDPRSYELLAPTDTAIVQEDIAVPTYTESSSGWRLTGVECTYGSDKKPLLRKDGLRVDESDSVNLGERTLRLDQTQLAQTRDEAAITCTWHNEFLSNSRLTLVSKVDGDSADPSQWTLTAQRVFGDAEISGTTGSGPVTNAKVLSGDYTLSSSDVEGYEGEWACVRTGTSQEVPVNADSQVSIPADSDVTCTVTHRPASRVISFTKLISGATDGAAQDDYSLRYVCTRAGRQPVDGTVTVHRDGSRVDGKKVPIGAQCTVTEAAPGAGSLVVPAEGLFTWREPVEFNVSSGADSVASTPDGDRGVRFTVPAGKDGLLVSVTNDVVPHAGVVKSFDGVVKSSTIVGGRETFDQTYTVVVSNPSSAQGLVYSVDDVAVAPSDSVVNSVTVSGGDPAGSAEVSGASWRVADAQLGAGASHTYVVTVNVSAPDSGLTGLEHYQGEQCVEGVPMVRNTATVTTKGDARGVSASACGDVPANPSFSVAKSGVDVTRNAGDDTFTASYEVTVTNTSHVDAAIAQDIRDRLSLPGSAKVDRVEIREGGAVTRVIAGAEALADEGFVLAEAGSGSPLAGVAEGSASGGGRRVLGVQVVFSVDASSAGYTASDYQCGAPRAEGQRPAGLINTVVMEGDRTGGDDTACLSADSTLKFSKTVASRPGAGSTFDVSYTISVVNEGALPGSTGQVKDIPIFPAGLVVNRVTIAKGSQEPRAVEADGSGAYPVSAGDVVASGQTLTWTVSANVSIDPGAADYSDGALACAADSEDVLQAGHGLFNRVVTEAGKDENVEKNHDVACTDVDAGAGRRSIAVVKTGSQGNLDGASFDVYPTDPSDPGASPIAGAVAPTGAKGEFTVSALPINREYWLVETRAPAGHQLLANPVHIKVTATGIEVLNAHDLGVSTATVSASSGQDLADTVTISDIEAGVLPLSGGHGIVPNVFACVLLVGAASTLALFTSARRQRSVR